MCPALLVTSVATGHIRHCILVMQRNNNMDTRSTDDISSSTQTIHTQAPPGDWQLTHRCLRKTLLSLASPDRCPDAKLYKISQKFRHHLLSNKADSQNDKLMIIIRILNKAISPSCVKTTENLNTHDKWHGTKQTRRDDCHRKCHHTVTHTPV